MHLVGFIVRIYRDARSRGHQIRTSSKKYLILSLMQTLQTYFPDAQISSPVLLLLLLLLLLLIFKTFLK